MIRSRILLPILLWSGLCLSAATMPAAADALRPEIGRPLQAAQENIKQKNFKEALAKIREAEAIPDKTAYETALIDQLRGAAAVGAGDPATAIRSFESLVAAGQLAPAEQLRFTRVIAELAYQSRDYFKAISWATRYYKEGGTDEQPRKLIAQAYYLQNDFGNAARELREQIHAEEQAGRPASEEQLQLLATACLKQNDSPGYIGALEKLVAIHPTPEYWADLINRISAKKGFSERLQLDVGRFSLAVGTITTADQYQELAQLALQAGLPGEAAAIIRKGTAAGAFGSATGTDADRQQRLRTLVLKSADGDFQALPSSEKEAAAGADGTGLVNTGLDYVGHGQADKGATLIEQGLRKGGLKHPDDARLHLGIAYFAAGHKDKAAQSFAQVEGSDGTADLARLWLLRLRSS